MDGLADCLFEELIERRASMGLVGNIAEGGVPGDCVVFDRAGSQTDEPLNGLETGLHCAAAVADERYRLVQLDRKPEAEMAVGIEEQKAFLRSPMKQLNSAAEVRKQRMAGRASAENLAYANYVVQCKLWLS